jgi:hypothetical protein
MSPTPKKARTARTSAATQATARTTTCPWCSAQAPAAAATCPSCGASLTEGPAGDIAGLTQIDPAAVSRASRVKPGRLASWLGAEAPPDSPALGGRVEPPSQEVREEMLRLELAALDAELEAARASQAAAELENQPEDAADASEAKPG